MDVLTLKQLKKKTTQLEALSDNYCPVYLDDSSYDSNVALRVKITRRSDAHLYGRVIS